MLNPEELSAWYEQLNLSQRARAVIDHVRSSEPARRVGGGRRNASGRYPSRKMGFTIQFESHRVELAGIYEMEHDDSVRYIKVTTRCLGVKAARVYGQETAPRT